MTLSKYQTWEREIINLLIDKMEIPNGDAQGIVEANSFTMQQGWVAGNTPEIVAEKISK